MNFKELKIKPKIGDSVYDIENTFRVRMLKPAHTIRCFVVEKVEEDGIWTSSKFLDYEFIYPSIEDCKMAIDEFYNEMEELND